MRLHGDNLHESNPCYLCASRGSIVHIGSRPLKHTSPSNHRLRPSSPPDTLTDIVPGRHLAQQVYLSLSPSLHLSPSLYRCLPPRRSGSPRPRRSQLAFYLAASFLTHQKSSPVPVGVHVGRCACRFAARVALASRSPAACVDRRWPVRLASTYSRLGVSMCVASHMCRQPIACQTHDQPTAGSPSPYQSPIVNPPSPFAVKSWCCLLASKRGHEAKTRWQQREPFRAHPAG